MDVKHHVIVVVDTNVVTESLILNVTSLISLQRLKQLNTIQTEQQELHFAYADGEKRYIIAPNGLKVGDTIISGEKFLQI